jgi:hypothetical protein
LLALRSNPSTILKNAAWSANACHGHASLLVQSIKVGQPQDYY